VHVLITADTVGGVWTYTRELTCGLLARGHRVTLVSFGRIPPPGQAFWVNHNHLNYYPTAFPLEWMEDAQDGIARSTEYLTRIIDDARPDILHFSQFCYGALPHSLPKVVVAHSDVLSWWNAVHGGEPPRSAWLEWYRDIVSQGLGGADAVVAPSRWMLDTLRGCYELPLRCSVIYNGRSEGLFRASTAKSDCVLSVGRIWDEAKQIRLLLKRRHHVPVRIAGSIHHPGRDSSDGWQLKPPGNFRFCGEQGEEQMRALYADSATYAATSRYEPFGLAPVEAALSRCALVVNDIPVFRELWGKAAFYFDRNDADSLAHAIRLLSECSLLRQLLGDLAYERARSQFDSARMTREYETLYRVLTGKSEAA
jgi:glycosyltransferase involved in cell wall biosynthesis